MKKPLIILLAIIVFLLPLMQIQQQTAQAAVTGKVISLAAKKIAKEVATDAAIEVVGNLALNYALPDPDSKYKVDTGKQLICLPGGKKNGVCETPAQLDVTRSKVTIGNAVESELDKAINNGKHFTKWQKFLDWFAPLWAISFGVTFLTYVFDSDVRTMFNEIAMNALYSIGAIEPVALTSSTEVIRPNIFDVNEDYLSSPDENIFAVQVTDSSYSVAVELTGLNISPSDYYNTLLQYRYDSNGSRSSISINGNLLFSHSNSTITFDSSLTNSDIRTNVILDGEVINTVYTTNPKTQAFINDGTTYPTLNKGYNMYLPYIQNGDMILEIQPLNSPAIFQVIVPNANIQLPTIQTIRIVRNDVNTSNSRSARLKIQTAVDRPVEVPLPSIEHISPMVNPLEMTPYVDGSIMTTPSPSTIPFRHSETGEPLHRDEQDPNIWRDPVGEPVPEELIEVGDPGIIKQPDGSHIAVPQPTPSNPNPLPEPITQPKPEAPLTPDKFEDNSCDIIRKPKLDPLATAVTTSFPFSIPWDVKRIYDALFANVGSERPEFVFKIPGYDQEFDIKLNPYFDDWVPFIRTIILLTFDIGILYAAYRWTKGGGE